MKHMLKEVLDQLLEDELTVCSLCIRLNPQHNSPDCTCEDKQERLRVINLIKKEI